MPALSPDARGALRLGRGSRAARAVRQRRPCLWAAWLRSWSRMPPYIGVCVGKEDDPSPFAPRADQCICLPIFPSTAAPRTWSGGATRSSTTSVRSGWTVRVYFGAVFAPGDLCPVSSRSIRCSPRLEPSGRTMLTAWYRGERANLPLLIVFPLTSAGTRQHVLIKIARVRVGAVTKMGGVSLRLSTAAVPCVAARLTVCLASFLLPLPWSRSLWLGRDWRGDQNPRAARRESTDLFRMHRAKLTCFALWWF